MVKFSNILALLGKKLWVRSLNLIVLQFPDNVSCVSICNYLVHFLTLFCHIYYKQVLHDKISYYYCLKGKEANIICVFQSCSHYAYFFSTNLNHTFQKFRREVQFCATNFTGDTYQAMRPLNWMLKLHIYIYVHTHTHTYTHIHTHIYTFVEKKGHGVPQCGSVLEEPRQRDQFKCLAKCLG